MKIIIDADERNIECFGDHSLIDLHGNYRYVPLEEVFNDIKAEIEECTRCPYGVCVGAGNCNDCMLMGKHAIDIIDKHINGKEQK